MFSERGQTLLEVVVAVVIMGVVLGALVIAVLTGLKNATLAQNQVQATKLAQETVEKIRTVRDRDGNITFDYSCFAGSCGGGARKFSGLWIVYMSSPTVNAAPPCENGVCYFRLRSRDPILEGVGPIPMDIPESELFKRQIIFEDENTVVSGTVRKFNVEKKITVRVLWTDSSGEHESKISTVLSKL